MKLNEIKDLKEAVYKTAQEIDPVFDWVKQYCKITGTFEIDPETLDITVHGNCTIEDFKELQLPYQFDLIDGDFLISDCKLENLKNSPRKVRNKYKISRCRNLESLEGLSLDGGVHEFMLHFCGGLDNLNHFPKNYKGILKLNDMLGLKNLNGLIVDELNLLKMLACDAMVDMSGSEIGKLHELIVAGCDRFASLNGCPKRIEDTITVSECPRMEIDEHIPEWCDRFSVEAPLFSFRKISNVLKRTHGIELYSSHMPRRGLLGAFDIKDLSYLVEVGAQDPEDLAGPYQILNECLSNHDDIFDCQQQMIDAGYEEYIEE